MNVIGQRRPKEMICYQCLVDAPEPVEGQMAEAAAHRVAHQQRTGEHGRTNRHPARHGEVRSASGRAARRRLGGRETWVRWDSRVVSFANDEIRMTNESDRKFKLEIIITSFVIRRFSPPPLTLSLSVTFNSFP